MRVHLVDGTFELFRAHFSPRPGERGADGRPLTACVGFAQSMLTLLDESEERATHVAVAFDNPIRSFRNDLFAGYKTEEGVDPDLLAQFDEAEDTARALGLVVWKMDRWEADDALATAAKRHRDEVEQVRILSPDKDLGQCLVGTRVVQIDRVRRKLIDEAALRERRGVGPESIADLLALVGDDADGIPGVPGFGEKSAAAVLAHYIHVEAIPDRAEEWKVAVRGAARLAAALAAERDNVRLYKQLATLVDDVPLPESLADLQWRGADRKAWQTWCDSAAVPELAHRPRRWR
jgi:5'-3' exonuclease